MTDLHPIGSNPISNESVMNKLNDLSQMIKHIGFVTNENSKSILQGEHSQSSKKVSIDGYEGDQLIRVAQAKCGVSANLNRAAKAIVDQTRDKVFWTERNLSDEPVIGAMVSNPNHYILSVRQFEYLNKLRLLPLLFV
jgi:hypothetical protein